LAIELIAPERGPKRGLHRRRGRPWKPRWISEIPSIRHFAPFLPPGAIMEPKEPILLSYDEFEALRLVDGEDLSQEEAAKRMGISRGTVWRLVASGRKKMIKAIAEGRELFIVPQAPVMVKEEETKD